MVPVLEDGGDAHAPSVIREGGAWRVYYETAMRLFEAVGRGVDWLVRTQDADGTWVERSPYFESVAVSGDGVFDTLKAVAKLVLKSLS